MHAGRLGFFDRAWSRLGDLVSRQGGMTEEFYRDKEFSIATDFSKFYVATEKSLSRQRIPGPGVSHVSTQPLCRDRAQPRPATTKCATAHTTCTTSV